MKNCIILKFFIIASMALSGYAYAIHVDEENRFLKESILKTPVTAVLSQKQVMKLPSNPDEWDIYLITADVLEPISGKTQKKINYKMYVEVGEDVILDSKPVIISLCGNEGDYYWPGVGAKFSASAELLKLAHQVAEKKSNLNPINSESHCE